jgi:hypothetical protein
VSPYVACRRCLAAHEIDWLAGWGDEVDEFVEWHYEEHGEFEFSILP